MQSTRTFGHLRQRAQMPKCAIGQGGVLNVSLGKSSNASLSARKDCLNDFSWHARSRGHGKQRTSLSYPDNPMRKIVFGSGCLTEIIYISEECARSSHEPLRRYVGANFQSQIRRNDFRCRSHPHSPAFTLKDGDSIGRGIRRTQVFYPRPEPPTGLYSCTDDRVGIGGEGQRQRPNHAQSLYASFSKQADKGWTNAFGYHLLKFFSRLNSSVLGHSQKQHADDPDIMLVGQLDSVII